MTKSDGGRSPFGVKLLLLVLAICGLAPLVSAQPPSSPSDLLTAEKARLASEEAKVAAQDAEKQALAATQQLEWDWLRTEVIRSLEPGNSLTSLTDLKVTSNQGAPTSLRAGVFELTLTYSQVVTTEAFERLKGEISKRYIKLDLKNDSGSYFREVPPGFFFVILADSKPEATQSLRGLMESDCLSEKADLSEGVDLFLSKWPQIDFAFFQIIPTTQRFVTSEPTINALYDRSPAAKAGSKEPAIAESGYFSIPTPMNNFSFFKKPLCGERGSRYLLVIERATTGSGASYIAEEKFRDLTDVKVKFTSGKYTNDEIASGVSLGVVQKPKLLSRIETPSSVRRSGEGGEVGIEFCVNTEGRATRATITKPATNKSLNESTLNAIKRAEFSPAADVKGNPIEMCISQLFTFTVVN